MHQEDNPTPPPKEWVTKLVATAISLYKRIWEDRNKFIHGHSKGGSLWFQHLKIQEQVT
jgi:hypothetical protein